MASQMINKDEKEQLSLMFKKFDTNHDGLLSKQEVEKGITQSEHRHVSQDELDELFD
jgi:Ca2+-binding EF-hand superfamily protein